jgi:BASS family bile acid:Na+ symporter
VLAVGLNAGRGDLLYVFRHPAKLAKAILAVIILPPIASGLIVSAAPLAPVAITAIMLMAISPAPPLVPGKQLAVGGRKAATCLADPICAIARRWRSPAASATAAE